MADGSRTCAVLIVEDDDLVRRSAARAIGEAGFEIYEAASAMAAERIARNVKIDLLFSDVMLGQGESGRSLARHFSERHPETRILLTTGYEEYRDSGAVEEFEVLKKPYHKEVLIARLRAILAGC